MNLVQLRGRAAEDLEQAAQFYEDQETGMGAWFADELFKEIVSVLGLFAGIHRQRHGMHYFISKRFPYGVYYRMEEKFVGGYAILDHRRDPRKLNQILRNR